MKGNRLMERMLAFFIMLSAILVTPSVLLADAPAPVEVIYVTVNGGAEAKDGTSWESAYSGASLQKAIDGAASNDCSVWVAGGVYTLTESLNLKKGAKVYGGFAGNETAPASRDLAAIAANKTVLSRDASVSSDIKFSIVLCSADIPANGATSTDTLIDGFTITGGTGTHIQNSLRGGGMYICNSSPTITNCTFEGNSAKKDEQWGYGGGLNNTGSSPVISHCTFKNNSANYGGAINNSGGSPNIFNCTIGGNIAREGGGIYNALKSEPMITNCTIVSNTAYKVNAEGEGGGIQNVGAYPTIANCIIRNNKAPAGSNIFAAVGSRVDVISCVVNKESVSASSSSTITSKDLIFADPVLGELSYNGGAVPTIAISAKGSAFRAGLAPGEHNFNGKSFTIPDTDARGVSFDATSADIGAYACKENTGGSGGCNAGAGAAALIIAALPIMKVRKKKERINK